MCQNTIITIGVFKSARKRYFYVKIMEKLVFENTGIFNSEAILTLFFLSEIYSDEKRDVLTKFEKKRGSQCSSFFAIMLAKPQTSISGVKG